MIMTNKLSCRHWGVWIRHPRQQPDSFCLGNAKECWLFWRLPIIMFLYYVHFFQPCEQYTVLNLQHVSFLAALSFSFSKRKFKWLHDLRHITHNRSFWNKSIIVGNVYEFVSQQYWVTKTISWSVNEHIPIDGFWRYKRQRINMSY